MKKLIFLLLLLSGCTTFSTEKYPMIITGSYISPGYDGCTYDFEHGGRVIMPCGFAVGDTLKIVKQ